jgi:transcriptional regulator with XRE-family HTH domain
MAASQDRQQEMSRQFGENVRRYRDYRDMSQADLAREMSARGWAWHQSTVYKIEHGERRTDAFEVHDLAAALRISIDRLFWAGAEANEIAMIDNRVATLRSAWRETALAHARLRAARSSAGSVLDQSRQSKYERARQAAEDIAAELEASTLESALAEGDRMYEHPEER